jgi:hypothetical protein
MRIVLSFICFSLLVNYGACQTIPINDFDYFVGCFALKDTADHKSADLSRFIEWKSIKPKPNYQGRDIRAIKRDKEKLWVWNWYALSKQQNEIKAGSDLIGYHPYRFFLLYDRFPQENNVGVLTIWEMVGEDSIRYVNGYYGDFDTERRAFGSIELVSIFPDTTILIAAKFPGEYTGIHRFFVGDMNRGFRAFYKSEQYGTRVFLNETSKKISYDFNELNESLYQAVEIIKYVTSISTHYTELDQSDFGAPRIDSVHTRILDLWDMVQEFREYH